MSTREDLKAYADGELSPERMEEVRVALEQDPSLQKEYEFMKFLSSEIKAAAKEPAVNGRPADVPLAKSKPTWLPSKTMLMVAAGIAVVFVVGVVNPANFHDEPGLQPTSATTTQAASNGAMDKTAAPMTPEMKSATSPSSAAAAPPLAERSVDTVQSITGTSEANSREMYRNTKADEAQPRSQGGLARPKDVAGGAGAPPPIAADAAKPADGSFPIKTDDTTVSSGWYRPTTTPAVTIHPTNATQVAPYLHDIVRTASEDIKVKNVRDAMDEVTKTVTAMQGFVGASNQTMAEGTSVATMNVRVPSTAYDSFITNVRHMGEVLTERTSGTDVTGQEIEVDSQINGWTSELKDLQKELSNTRNSSDRIDLKDKIRDVQIQINAYNAEQTDTKAQAKYATFDLTFREKALGPQQGDWFGDSFSGSSQILAFIGTGFGRGLVYLLVLSPIWLPVIIIAWLINRKNKKS